MATKMRLSGKLGRWLESKLASKLVGQAGWLAGTAGIAGMAGRLAGWQAGKPPG